MAVDPTIARLIELRSLLHTTLDAAVHALDHGSHEQVVDSLRAALGTAGTLARDFPTDGALFHDAEVAAAFGEADLVAPTDRFAPR